MKALLILAAIFVCSEGAGTCVHSNHNNLEEAHVINMVVAAVDVNGDGLITDVDIIGYFIQHFDKNFNFEVDMNEFTSTWNALFHDSIAFAEHVFDHIDTDNNQKLDILDIAPLVDRADTSRDGKVQIAEFKAYLEAIYAAC